MLRLMEAKHYQNLFNLNLKYINATMKSSQESINTGSAENTLELLLYMCSAIINDDIYPSDWSDLLILRDE